MADNNLFRNGALADLRVIELGGLIAGPSCGQLTGDMGADAITVEPSGQPDPMRTWGSESTGGKSLWWPVVSRNKRSITLDLRVAEGQAPLKQLVARSDFLLENFRPGTMEKWGRGREQLSAINPRLIMIRVCGYSQTGPYADRAGFGSIGEAMGGLRHVVGDPSTPPSRTGISIGDELAATFACVGALSALRYRHRTGAILPNVAPPNVYPTGDGQWLLIAANQDAAFTRLCNAMSQPQLATNPRYATPGARGARQSELDQLIADWTRSQPLEALLRIMNRNGVPAGLIYRAPEMLADPHFQARQAITEVPHPDFGTLKMQNVAPRLSATPGSIRSPSPQLGEHNRAVCLELLGLTSERYDALRAATVI